MTRLGHEYATTPTAVDKRVADQQWMNPRARAATLASHWVSQSILALFLVSYRSHLLGHIYYWASLAFHGVGSDRLLQGTCMLGGEVLFHVGQFTGDVFYAQFTVIHLEI